MDIHSGGIDLRFPHHENEVAQVGREGGRDGGREGKRSFFIFLFPHHENKMAQIVREEGSSLYIYI